ncbi:MAG: hypothetical protein ACXV8Y_17325 [Acidimicrobiia bacterium]
MRRSTVDRALLAVGLGGVAGLLVWRVVAHGILPIAPDDAEYIGVGRRLLALQSPTRVNGQLYTIRSWVWPILTGTASRLMPGDVFRGPKALGVLLGLVALAGAVWFAYRRRGGVAAVATAAALGLTSVAWEVAASTRVDVALLAFLVVTMIVAAEPSPRRVILAGVLAGVTLLVKESSALLVLLPFAWFRRDHYAAWRRIALHFWMAFAAAVSWWFVFILVTRDEVFPFEGLQQAVNRNVPRAWSPNVAAWALVALWVVAVLVLVLRSSREPGIRVIGIAFVALIPPAAIAWTKELALRQFAPLAIVGALAIGVAVGDLVARASGRLARRTRTGIVIASGVVIAVVAIGPVFHVQRDSVYVTAPILDMDTANWIRAHTAPGTLIASTFRFEALTWARVGDRNDFNLLDFKNPVTPPAIGDQVWLDWSDGSFHSLARADLGSDADRAGYIVLTGRHRLGPMALALWLDDHGESVGIVPAAKFGVIGTPGWVHVYKVGTPKVAGIPTLVTADALQHLSDTQVEQLDDIVVTGVPEVLDRQVVRLAQLGRPASTLVTPLE